jgi:hypothetical protein
MFCIRYFLQSAGILFLAFSPFAIGFSDAQAGEIGFAPKLSGNLAVEVQNDFAFSSDDPAEEFNNLTTKIGPGLTLTLTDSFSVNAGLVFQQVQTPPVTGDDRVLDDQGLFVEVLTLDYKAGPVHLSGGKMGINFGTAWDVTPGVFGTDLAAEYEMAEYIGLSGAYSFASGDAGTHTITAQTFFLDTSGLAESAFTRRKKTREAAGGPGNTGNFKSFAVSLDGGDIPAFKGFSYHAAYVHHANDTVGAESESRVAVNGAYEFALPGNITAQPLIEYVRFDDADGTQNQDRTYLTAALGLTYGDWNIAISGTLKETEAADGTKIGEEHFQVSAGYAFPIGIGLDVAYKRVRNAGVDTDVFGTLVTYGLEF